MKNKFTLQILSQKNIFSYFKHAYLFGSVLTSKKPNDIDILLVYENFSDKIFVEREKISKDIYLPTFMPIHFSLLSSKELLEADFLTEIATYLAIYP